VVPDLGEYARSYRIFKPSLDALGGRVTLGHLKEASAKSGGFDPLTSFQSLFAGAAPDPAPAGAAADVFLVTNVSCVEVPNLEAYAETVAKGKALSTWWVGLGGGLGFGVAGCGRGVELLFVAVGVQRDWMCVVRLRSYLCSCCGLIVLHALD